MEKCSHKTFVRIRIDNELQNRFKEYCISKDTTMSKVLIDYITTLVGNVAESTAPAQLYYCPYCVDDLTSMTEVNRLKHIDICEKLQNGVFCSRIPPILEKNSVLL